MPLSQDQLSELKTLLLNVALVDFAKFCKIGNLDLDQAYVCMQRKKGKSYSQIGKVLNKSKQAVAQRAKKCG